MDEGNSNMGENQPTEPQGLFTPPEKLIEVDETALVPQQPQSIPTRSNSTTPSGTGDIKLPRQKKSHKGLIIVTFAVVLICVVGAGIYALVSSLNNSDSASSYQTAFNEYANFFLYNTDSKEKITGQYDYGSLYYLANLTDMDEADKHLSESEKKYQSFMAIYNNYASEHPDSSNPAFRSEMTAYYENLDMWRYERFRPGLDSQTILGLFTEKLEDAERLITEYYSVFSESEVEQTRSLGESYRSQSVVLLSAYTVFKENGCLEDGYVASACRYGDNPDLADANNALDVFLDFYNRQIQEMQNLDILVYQTIWIMNQELPNA